MAIFTPSAPVGSISGNLGGSCFVNSSGSKVIRKTQRVVKSRSFELRNNRSRFANYQRQWRELTESQQSAWRTYAISKPFTNRLGIPQNFSGFQIFVKTKLNLYEIFGESRDDPPTPDDNSQQGPITITSSVSGGLDLVLPAYASGFITNIIIRGRLLWTDSVPKFAGNLRLVGSKSFISSTSPTTIDFSSTWESVFLLPVLDQVVAVRTSYASTDHLEWGSFDQIVKTTA